MAPLWPWLRVLAGVGILATLGWQLGVRAFVDGVRVIDARAVLAALGIGLLTTVVCAWRWQCIALRVGLPLTLPAAVAEYYRALVLNAVLPAGVLGDVDRGVRHGRAAGDVARGVRVVAYERVAGQVVFLAVGFAVLLSHPGLLAALADRIALSRDAGLFALGVLAAVLAVVAWATQGRWRAAVRTAVAEVRTAVLSRDGGPQVLGLSVLALAGHLALFVVAARVAGVTASIGTLVPLAVLALLAMLLPVNVGGWGPREATSALAFGAAGLGAEQGLATAVVYGVLALVAGAPGAAVLVAPQRAVGQRLGLRPAVPGDDGEQHEQDRGEDGTSGRADRELGDDGADHDAHEPERGEPAQHRDQQADRPGDLHGGREVAEPLAQADAVDRLGDVLVAGEHRQRGEDHQVGGERELQDPHRDVHQRGGPRRLAHVFVRGHSDLPSPVVSAAR